MSQPNFCYGAVQNGDGRVLSVSIYADRAAIRMELCEDAQAAGLDVRVCTDLSGLAQDCPPSLHQVVLVDCPAVDAACLAALCRLDERAAHCGAQLVISTSFAALDDVFACCDKSDVQILVDPPRGERVVALGLAMARVPGTHVRELSAEDRLHLLRLTEQVGRIAERLDCLSPVSESVGLRLESPSTPYRGATGVSATDTARRGSAQKSGGDFPDPKFVRQLLRVRQMRGRFFDAALFADPAWDMLLDLTAAQGENARVSVTSLCLASGVPCTTALRWIGQMTQSGLLRRVRDDVDRRRAFIVLSDQAADAMGRYFAELGLKVDSTV